MDRPALVTVSEEENLPSFGMSYFLNLESGVETAAMLKKIRDGPACKELSGHSIQDVLEIDTKSKYRQNSANNFTIFSQNYPSRSTLFKDLSGNDSDELMTQGSSATPGPSRMILPTTRGNNEPIQVYVEDTDEHDDIDPTEYGFKFAAATKPIGTTVDASQILDIEMVDEMLSEKPKLHVNMITDYLRFRYMSEKLPKKKGTSRPRHYDHDGEDKHCFAEVRVDNYVGTGKIVAYCVDGYGRLHPYNLFGEKCYCGVYVNKYQFRRGKVAKLMKVSVTTPKTKEYQANLKNQMSYLEEIGLEDVKSCNHVDDKQVVYVMVKVILDDNKILSEISTPLHNKKKGKEFCIQDIQPVTAPASGEVNCNILKTQVILVVTEDTAFPSEVGVKIRKRNTNGQIVWEEELSGDKIQVIKLCVVRFVPPPYRYPNTREDVEVDICLFDKKTKRETLPVKFIYKGSDNYGLESKAKKRKLDKEHDLTVFLQDNTTQGSRKILAALRTIPASSSPRNSDSSSSDHSGSSPDNSLTYIQESQNYSTDHSANNLLPSNETQVVASGSDDQTVSLLELRTTAEQLPFSSYKGNVEQSQIVGQSIFGTSDSQTVQQLSRPQFVGFNGGAAGTSQLSNFNINQVVTSSTSVFTGCQQTATYQTTPVTMPTISVNSCASIPSFQQQTQTSQPTNMHGLPPVIISETDRMALQQQGVQLPKLGDNQMFAIVDGQIYVVNDDTVDPSTNAASILAPYNALAPVIQNIGQQQVIVQHITPQQPSSEMEQQASQILGATIVTQRNSAPIQNLSQGTFQIQTAGSVTQTLGSLQHATGNSAPISGSPAQTLATQQQYLREQEQQRQLAEQLLQHIASEAGLDLNQPGVKQEILQQIIGLQGQGQQQTQSLSDTSQLFASGSDLNDDDVEIDGVENPESNEQTTEMEQRTKMLRGSSNIERDKTMPQNIIVENLPPQVGQGQIPTFVTEDISVNEDQTNALVSCHDQGD